MAILEWFLTGSIYGIALVAACFAGIGLVTQRIHPKLSPALFGSVAFVVALIVLPSYPRFKFEGEINATLAKYPSYRMVNSAKWGSLTEPLTWFVAPIGFADLITPAITGPESFGEDAVRRHSYQRVILRFEEPKQLMLITADCNANEISVSEPDKTGTMRYVRWSEVMKGNEKSIYCDTDWSREKKNGLRSFGGEYEI